MDSLKLTAVICLIIMTFVAALGGLFSSNPDLHKSSIRLLVCALVAGGSFILGWLADRAKIDYEHHFWLSFIVGPAILFVFVISILVGLVYFMAVAVNA